MFEGAEYFYLSGDGLREFSCISDPGSASDPLFRLLPAPEKYSKSSDGKDQWLREVRGQRQQRQTPGDPPLNPQPPSRSI